MAICSTYISVTVVLLLLQAFTLPVVQGEDESPGIDINPECGLLPINKCAFAVDSSGNRCVLEEYTVQDIGTVRSCHTSQFIAANPEGYTESDECVTDCGLDRMTIGTSTKILFSFGFGENLCSKKCQSCRNIVDHFNALISAEPGYYGRWEETDSRYLTDFLDRIQSSFVQKPAWEIFFVH